MNHVRKPKAPDQPQGKDGPAGSAAAPPLGALIGNQAMARDLGDPLPPPVRSRMEPALGHDLSAVRIHTSEEAAAAADRMDARAFAVGPHIGFNRGEFQPGTLAGDALIAHELAHTVQQRGAPAVEGGAVQPESAASEHDANRAATGVVSSLWARARSIAAAAVPAVQSGLSLQRCGKGNKQPKTPQAGAPATAAPAAKADPLAPRKAAMAKKYGFKDVVDTDAAQWTAAELTKVEKMLDKLPAEGSAAIQGVTLQRVAKPSCQGDTDACFVSGASAAGERHDSIEMGNGAFAPDADLESNKKPPEILPSQESFLHEVGHAVESAQRRAAESKALAGVKEPNAKQDALHKAIQALNNATPNGVSVHFSNPAEKAYTDALLAGQNTSTVFNGINALEKVPTKAGLATALSATKKELDVYKAVLKKRDAAKKKLPASSAAIDTAAESAQNDFVKAADDVVKALEARHAAADTFEALEKAKAASERRFNNDGATVDGTRNVAEVVALVHLKGIDIKKSGMRGHIKKNWPANPGELYADLFQMSVTEQAGLKAFDKDLAAYFESPIGVKGAALKKKVDAWISGHAAP